MRFPQFVAVTLLAVMCALAPAQAEKRVALVIGNERYVNLPANEQLQKAVNDARAVGGALRQIGFEVISGENVGRQGLLARLDEAAQRITPGDTVFFFFSGHGVAMNNVNYVLPADVPAVGSGQITSLTGAAVKEEDITERFLGAGARVAVVVLDACRNNPFASAGTKGVGGEKGLAPHDPPSGVFTLYAASRGEAALDRLYDGDRDPNSVFTRALLPALVRPGLDLPGLALEVRKEVTRLASSVNHAQRPAYYDETSGDRIFLAGQQVAVVPPATLTVPAGHPCSGAATVSLAARRAAPLSAAEECSLKPKDSFQECGSCPEMVVVPAGSFTMGSPADEKSRSANEGPQHTVTISKPFAVGKFHVTRDQFAAFVQKTGYAAQTDCSREGGGLDGSWRDPGFAQEGSHPVVCVRWNDTKAYVDWVAKETGKPYRLLSEAEWEYAARGRTSPGAYPRFWFGDDEKEICRYANGDTSAWCNDGYKYTSPVGNYAPNAFGLYDMTGNAYQWLADCLYDDGYNGAPADGSAWTSGNCAGHAARGGSFRHYPWYLRAAYRNASHNANGNDSGFRLARTLTP